MANPKTPRSYAFSVTDFRGRVHDVYRFVKDGKRGTMAFTRVGEKWLISVFCAGTLSEAAAEQAVNDSMRSEEN